MVRTTNIVFCPDSQNDIVMEPGKDQSSSEDNKQEMGRETSTLTQQFTSHMIGFPLEDDPALWHCLKQLSENEQQPIVQKGPG